jgi:hypothetical protein
MMQLLPAGLHVLFCGGALIHLFPLTPVGFEAEAGTASTNITNMVMSKTNIRFFIALAPFVVSDLYLMEAASSSTSHRNLAGFVV